MQQQDAMDVDIMPPQPNGAAAAAADGAAANNDVLFVPLVHTDDDGTVCTTSQAVALLQALPRDLGSPYVFPAVRGGMLSDMALSQCMRRINEARLGGYLDKRSGRPAVPHGLRSTFRDWASEQGVSHDLAERALAHAIRNAVEAAYHRTDLVEQRRGVMEAWAAHVTGRSVRGKIVA